MAEPLRHRQTKGAETDMPSLPPPRHIPTLHPLRSGAWLWAMTAVQQILTFERGCDEIEPGSDADIAVRFRQCSHKRQSFGRTQRLAEDQDGSRAGVNG